MKIPKELMIKGHLWKVEYKWRLADPDIGLCNGLCDPAIRVIFIDRLLPKEQKWLVFLHELNHAVVHELHLNEHGGVEGFAQEALCSGMADVYDQLFKFRWKRKKP